MDYKFSHVNQTSGSFLKIIPNDKYQLHLGDILEIGSNEFKVTTYEAGKICELTIVLGMTDYL